MVTNVPLTGFSRVAQWIRRAAAHPVGASSRLGECGFLSVLLDSASPLQAAEG